MVFILEKRFENVDELSEDFQSDQFKDKAGLPNFIKGFLEIKRDC